MPERTARRKSKASDPFDEAVGRRLRLVRTALGLTQREFAGSAAVATNTYGQWETGARALSPAQAIELCDTHNLTLDWIYRGDPGNLPYKLATALKALSDLKSSP